MAKGQAPLRRTLAQARRGHGGSVNHDVLGPLQDFAQSHEIVGIDRVEVAPDCDPSGSTNILAAQVLLNLLMGGVGVRKG